MIWNIYPRIALSISDVRPRMNNAGKICLGIVQGQNRKGCNEIQKDNKALGVQKYAFIAVACFSRFSPYLYLFTIVMTFHLSLLGTLGLGNSWVKLPPRNNNGKKSGILCCVHVVHVLFRNKSKKALANVTAMSNFWRVDCAGYIA